MFFNGKYALKSVWFYYEMYTTEGIFKLLKRNMGTRQASHKISGGIQSVVA